MRFTKFCDIKLKFFCIIFSFSISVKSVKTHFETIWLLFSILSTKGLSTPILILWYEVHIRLSMTEELPDEAQSSNDYPASIVAEAEYPFEEGRCINKSNNGYINALFENLEKFINN